MLHMKNMGCGIRSPVPLVVGADYAYLLLVTDRNQYSCQMLQFYVHCSMVVFVLLCVGCGCSITLHWSGCQWLHCCDSLVTKPCLSAQSVEITSGTATPPVNWWVWFDALLASCWASPATALNLVTKSAIRITLPSGDGAQNLIIFFWGKYGWLGRALEISSKFVHTQTNQQTETDQEGDQRGQRRQ